MKGKTTMIKKKVFWFLLTLAQAAVLLSIGCTPPKPGLRFTYIEIEKYPAEIQEAIRKKEVIIGMTPIQVRYALGPPESARTFSPRENDIAEEWTYRSVMEMKTVYVVFEEGKVSRVSTEQRRVPTIRLEKVD